MNPGLRRWSRGALIALSFLFLGLLLVRQRERLSAYAWRVDPLRLGLATIAFAAVLVAGVGIWRRTLRGFGVRVRFPVLARIWFLSNLSRYIPGKVWQFVGVVELSRAAGVPALAAITSLLVYMGVILLAACFVGAYLLPAAGPFATAVTVLRFASPVLVVLVHPRAVNTAVRWASRLTRRPPLTWNGRWLDGVALFGLCVLEWLGLGAAFALFVSGIAAVGPDAFATLIAAFALSFVAGYAALLPAGLGAKEGALAILLGTVVPLPVAAAIAVAARAWTVVAESIPAFIFLRPTRGRPVVRRPDTDIQSAEETC